MNTTDINVALRGRMGDKARFLGCYPADFIMNFKLPMVRKNDLVIILNTLSSSSDIPMGHWYTVVIRKSPLKQVYVFDSLCLPLSKYLKIFLEKNNLSCFMHEKRLQPLDSLFCAFYALYFTHKVLNYGFCKAVWSLNKYFSVSRLKDNDKYVLLYYMKQLNAKPCKYIWRYTKPKLSMAICTTLSNKKQKR